MKVRITKVTFEEYWVEQPYAAPEEAKATVATGLVEAARRREQCLLVGQDGARVFCYASNLENKRTVPRFVEGQAVKSEELDCAFAYGIVTEIDPLPLNLGFNYEVSVPNSGCCYMNECALAPVGEAWTIAIKRLTILHLRCYTPSDVVRREQVAEAEDDAPW